MSIPTFELNDGSTLPAVGFGTYSLRGSEGVASMVSAIEAGYRLLDSAVNYENEHEVGQAVRDSGLDRSELQVVTKVPGRMHAYADTLACVNESLERMQLDYIDIVLIHWPNPSVGLFREAWRGLVEARDRDLVRVIGVSNFTRSFLDDIIKDSGVVPAINQIELHPYFPQDQMRQVNEHLDIQTVSWSPLGKRNAPYHEPVIQAAATKYNVTPAQVILRWHYQLGALAIPKAATPEHQRTNIDIFGFQLSEQEMTDISALGRPDGRLFDGDPNTHEEM